MLPRTIPLETATNLRDIGGYACEGGHIRQGLLFRAPALVALSEADQARIAELGLRTVCDFRAVKERARNPVEIPGAASLSLPIAPRVGGSPAEIARTGERTGHVTPAEMRVLLAEAYREFALESAAEYRGFFARILSPGALPLLYHCSAGKDRTGLATAFVHAALGVAWENILTDYMATGYLWNRKLAFQMKLPPEVQDVLLGVDESLLQGAFDAIAGRFGSIHAYLREALGLDATALRQLRALLVQS